MHPVVRLTSFIFLLVGLAVTSHVVVVGGVLLLLLLFRMRHSLFSTLSSLRYLRGFLLSLFVLNVWFSSSELTWLPTIASVLSALEKTAILIIAACAAHVFISVTPIQEVVGALQWFFRPFNSCYFSSERLAVRLALILNIVHTVQTFYATIPASSSAPAMGKMSYRSAQLFRQVLIQAETTPLYTLEIPELVSPPYWQWGYPLLISILILTG